MKTYVNKKDIIELVDNNLKYISDISFRIRPMLQLQKY